MNDDLLSGLLMKQIHISPENSGSLGQHAQPEPLPLAEFLNLGPDAYRPERSKLYDQPYDLIPKDTDVVDELTTKAQRVADVITEGASLALTTNKLLTTNVGRTPEQIACSIMTATELDLYDAWKGGLLLPPIDFDKSRKPSTGKRVNTRIVRGEAMKRLYKNDSLQEEHYLWFADSYSFLMPLVSAIMKLVKAERNLNQGDATMNQLDLEECQTINKLVASFTSRRANLAKYRISFMNRAVHRAVTFATARKAAIHQKCKTDIAQVTAANQQGEVPADLKQPVKHEYLKRKGQALRLSRNTSSCSRM